MNTNTICQAIKDRHVISFRYKGDARTAEPHLLGYDDSGDLTLSAWQLSGGSGVGWRDFHVSKLSELRITTARFQGARHGYNPNDRTIDRIVCRL
ncbi:WYL domain-containing protein [Oceanibaculum indicum]|uniref:WYL domain-containing protein n=1 Tax=Oceanibaculum indicum TaxID=526216 RepID=A0A420WMK6_9PROT|nr:WYL domain-containing protein [Oceanibaculum indicum]RKQ72243.1 hypothetical protein BCL74_0001 [Oceanibaculum indicum]